MKTLVEFFFHCVDIFVFNVGQINRVDVLSTNDFNGLGEQYI